MDPIVLFLKENALPKVSLKLTRYREKLLGSSYLWTKICIKDPSLAHTYYAYTLKQLSCSWKNYMRGFMEATQGANLYLIGSSHKVIGDRIYRKKHKNM